MPRIPVLPLFALVWLVGCKDRSSGPSNWSGYGPPSPVAVAPMLPASPAPAPPPPGPVPPPSLAHRTILDITFVEIPAGSFLMGAPVTEPGFDPRQKQRLVVIPTLLWMGQTEVTQAQYQMVTGKNPSLTKGDNLPVTRVSWEEVQEFLKAVNQQSPAFHLRLPTEEEWEYACRAGSELPFAPPGRNAEDLQQALQKQQQGDPEFLVRFVGRFAWFNQGHPHPVGSLLPNAWGLFDMHGNVWEWCADDAPDGDLRPLRGGSWATSEVFGCRAALRAWEPRDTCKDSIGFRLVAEPR